MPKLVILTQYYPPETGAPQNRLSDLARRMTAQGYQVEVLTALPNYPENSVFDHYRGRENTSEMLDGIRVNRVGIYVPKQKTFIKRILHYLSFVFNVLCYGGRLVREADIVLMESPPIFIAWAGVYLSKKWGAKLIVNISDLWPQSAVEMGMLSFVPGVWAAQKLEDWMYKKAALVTGQTQGIVTDIQRRFPDKKVRLFPNGVDTSSYKNLPDRQKARARFRWGNELFVIGYAGVLGHAQKLEQILDAGLLLKDLPQIHFALFGDGPCKQKLQDRIEKEQITNVKIYSKVSAEEMPAVYAGMDCGCVPLGKEKIFKGARPSKMFEMMASGLPLALCAEGESVEILNAPQGGPAGFHAFPEQPEIFAKKIREIVFQPQALKEMGARGREFVFEHFDRENIAKNLATEFLELLESKNQA